MIAKTSQIDFLNLFKDHYLVIMFVFSRILLSCIILLILFLKIILVLSFPTMAELEPDANLSREV